MNLRILLPGLAAALLAACGGATETPAGGATADSAATYREGTHYHRLATPVEAGANEITEVFNYACPACAQFQPEIDAFKREKGDAVSIRYVPAEFHPTWAPFARAYHAFQELGAFGRLHRALFEALYVQGRQLQTIEDIADVAALAGIDRATFLEVAASPAVEAGLERSREFTRAVGVTSTPSLIVAGRYRVERAQPGSAKALEVADWLLANTP
jgi:thiol:disulfide interchange protein DsbA